MILTYVFKTQSLVKNDQIYLCKPLQLERHTLFIVQIPKINNIHFKHVLITKGTGTEKISDLLKDTNLLSDIPRIWTQIFCLQVLYFSQLPPIKLPSISYTENKIRIMDFSFVTVPGNGLWSKKPVQGLVLWHSR